MILLFLACAVFLLPTPSIAKTEVIYATHKTVMGDNDSKNDARRICLLEAKRKVIEKAGTYIESRTKVTDYKLTKDEITTYAAAILKVNIVEEKWKLVGENMAIEMRVRAEVDPDYVEKELARIKKDTALQSKLKEQQGEIERLEKRITRLQSELDTAPYQKSVNLRQERNSSFESIDDADKKLKSILLAVKKREEEREKLKKEIRKQEAERARTVRKVLQHLKIGMTGSEVVQIIEAITGYATGLPGTSGSGYWDKLVFLYMTDKVTGQSALYYIKFVSEGCTKTIKSESWDVLKSWEAKKKAISACPELRRYIWGEE